MSSPSVMHVGGKEPLNRQTVAGCVFVHVYVCLSYTDNHVVPDLLHCLVKQVVFSRDKLGFKRRTGSQEPNNSTLQTQKTRIKKRKKWLLNITFIN